MSSIRDTLLLIAQTWGIDPTRMLAPWNLTAQMRKDLHMQCLAERLLNDAEATRLEIQMPAVVLTVGRNERMYLVYMSTVTVNGEQTKTPLCVDWNEQCERVEGTQNLDAPRRGRDGRQDEGDNQ